MRLINTSTLALEEIPNSKVGQYGILSHTWEEEEVTFEDMEQSQRPSHKQGYAKIESVCREARGDGLPYVWVDTCCIDKKSSAELQEVINSMFAYYSKATICYVYLSDIPSDCPYLQDGVNEEIWKGRFVKGPWRERFRGSKWFSRGWTLQELIAPTGEMRFYSNRWDLIGHRRSLIKTISTATRIDPSILTHSVGVASMSVAQRMSWAAHRQTSRVEDKAYCLLGLFNVNMPMLYGEGERAFIRLQEEILKTSTDHSIFAWELTDDYAEGDGSLLAPSPANFTHAHRIVRWGKPAAFQMTNRGLQIALPTLNHSRTKDYIEYFGILNCRYANDLSGTLALRLQKYGGAEEYHTMKGAVPLQPNFVPKGKVRPRSRLTFIPERQMPHTAPHTLQITRDFEPETSKIKFWIPLSPQQGCDYQVIEPYPKENWDMNDGLMYAGDALKVRGGVVVESTSGFKFAVVFGFDVVQSENKEEKEFLLPGVWGSPSPAKSGIQSLVKESYSVCQHVSQSCAQGRCFEMPSTVTVYESPATQKLELRIYKATIMTETVFVVDFRIEEVFELEAAENYVEVDVLSSLTLENTEHKEIKTEAFEIGIEPEYTEQINNPQPEEGDDSISPLEPDEQTRREKRPWYVRKGLSATQAAVQIWIRLPKILQLVMWQPQEVIRLPGNILFWEFRECSVTAGTVVLSTRKGSEVILSFRGNDTGSVRIFAWGNPYPGDAAKTRKWLQSLRSFPESEKIKHDRNMNTISVPLLFEKAEIEAELVNAEVPGKISYAINVRFLAGVVGIDDFDALGGAETSNLDTEKEEDAGGLNLALMPFFSGDHNWNAPRTEDSTFNQTNVLND